MSDTDPTELRTHVLWELALGEKFLHRYTEDDQGEHQPKHNKTKYKTQTYICRSGINLSHWSYIPCIALHMQRMWDVALQLHVFANDEGEIICNGNIWSYFGISTNYQGQDQILTQIRKLSSEQGRDEKTIQQINSRPVTKKKGIPSYYTPSKLSLLFQRRKKRLQILSSLKP